MLALMSVFHVLLQLDLSNNELCGLDVVEEGTYTAEGINALAEAVAVNASLTVLKLGPNKIGDDGAASIASALKESTQSKLAELDLNGYGAEDMQIGPKGAKALADMLSVNGSLTSVS